MIPALSIAFLLGVSPQTMILYGADATFAGELAAQLDPQKWNIQIAPAFVAKRTVHPAVEKFTRGKLAYDDLLFEEAMPALSAAREEYEKTILEPEQWPGYQQTLLYLALTLDGMGKAEPADAVLDALAALAPDPSIVNETFPPPFRKKVAERLQMRPAKMGSLRIESKPAGANVLLNGRMRGRTPLVVTELPGGDYTVSLVLAGHTTVTRKVAVIAGFGIGAEATPDLVEAQLGTAVGVSAEQALKVVATNRLPDASLSAALQNSQRDSNKVAGIFIAATSDQTIAAVLPTKGKWRGPATVAGNVLAVPPLRAQLTSQIVDWVNFTEPKVVPPVPVVPAQLKTDTSSRWWLWTGLGALVAGGATAAVIAAQSPEREETTGDVVVGW